MASSSINDIKFGTDGWRGITAWDFNFENVRKVAQAVADYIRSKTQVGQTMPPVVIGYDRRFLSDQFASDVARILRSNKIDVTLSDRPLPTQAISLLTEKKFHLGVVITASHNPFNYNGFKIKTKGFSAPEEVTKEVESMLGRAPALIIHSMPVDEKPIVGQYVQYLKTKINAKNIAAGLKQPVVIDNMNGCSAGILQEVLPYKKLIAIRAEHDPLFGGGSPEPIEKNLTALAKAVRDNKAVVGLAFDGDADRIGVIDEKGNYISPCQLFPILLDYLISHKKLSGKILECVSLGYLGKRIAREKGLQFEEVPVGFKNISAKMTAEDILAGAEESGGYAWKGNIPERDGIMTGLLLLEIIAKTGKKPSELLAAVESKYGKSAFIRKDFSIKKTIADKAVFAEKIRKKLPKKICGMPIAETLTMDGLKIIFQNDNWLLMRPSGTEPLMRTYAETESAATTKAVLEYAEKLIASYV